jgi:hypothetical protein
MFPPTFKRALIDAAKADAVRSSRYAHHHRDWDLQRGNPILRLLRRAFGARGWRLARRDRTRRDTTRRAQAVAADTDVPRS